MVDVRIRTREATKERARVATGAGEKQVSNKERTVAVRECRWVRRRVAAGKGARIQPRKKVTFLLTFLVTLARETRGRGKKQG